MKRSIRIRRCRSTHRLVDNMPSYKVVLKDEAKTELRITAEDVDIDSCQCCDEGCNTPAHFYNFLNNRDDDEPTTVAAIPFDTVLYITS